MKKLNELKKMDLRKRKKDVKESLIFKLLRSCSYPLTWLFVRTPITANQVSILSFIFIVCASLLFIFNQYAFTILGGILVWFGMVLDCVDGEVARIKNQSSLFGFWLDGALGKAGDVLVFIGISIGVYQQYPSIYTLILALLATISTTTWRHLNLWKISCFESYSTKKPYYKPIGFDMGMQYFIITVGALFNQLLIVLIFFAVAINLTWMKNIILTARSKKNERKEPKNANLDS